MNACIYGTCAFHLAPRIPFRYRYHVRLTTLLSRSLPSVSCAAVRELIVCVAFYFNFSYNTMRKTPRCIATTSVVVCHFMQSHNSFPPHPLPSLLRHLCQKFPFGVTIIPSFHLPLLFVLLFLPSVLQFLHSIPFLPSVLVFLLYDSSYFPSRLPAQLRTPMVIASSYLRSAFRLCFRFVTRSGSFTSFITFVCGFKLRLPRCVFCVGFILALMLFHSVSRNRIFYIGFRCPCVIFRCRSSAIHMFPTHQHDMQRSMCCRYPSVSTATPVFGILGSPSSFIKHGFGYY